MSARIAFPALVVAGPVLLGIGIWLLATLDETRDKTFAIYATVFGAIVTLLDLRLLQLYAQDVAESARARVQPSK